MLELNKIRKSYDGVTILDNISLSIESGEILSILGPSGCGKTTLLNLILGITDVKYGLKAATSPVFPWRNGDSTLCFRITHCSLI